MPIKDWDGKELMISSLIHSLLVLNGTHYVHRNLPIYPSLLVMLILEILNLMNLMMMEEENMYVHVHVVQY